MAEGRLLAVSRGTAGLALSALMGASACGGAAASQTSVAADTAAGLALTPVVTGLRDPLYVTAPVGDDRLFVVEQAGRIVIVRNGSVAGTFLDLTDRVGSGGERGLLSLAFHPRYADTGRLFVNYTDRSGATHVAEFHAAPAGDAADPASERTWLTVGQPFANHNGGLVAFGPDGRLYVGMGDGGAGGDPNGNAQNPRALLGKLLRLDVDGGMAGTTAPEVWALGLRNPWRFAFDDGLLYIADVGQNHWEEINVAPAGSSGINYGWRTREGAHCYLNPLCSAEGLHEPAWEYDHEMGCSVTGGVVYRGTHIPALLGHYIFSDYCEGWLRSFRWADGAATDVRVWQVRRPGAVTSFGTDGHGEVCLTVSEGTVYRIDPAP